MLNRVLIFGVILLSFNFSKAGTFLDFDNYSNGQVAIIPIAESGSDSSGTRFYDDIRGIIRKDCGPACDGHGGILTIPVIDPLFTPIDIRWFKSTVDEISFISINADFLLGTPAASFVATYANSSNTFFFDEAQSGAAGFTPKRHIFKAPAGYHLSRLKMGHKESGFIITKKFGVDEFAVNGGALPKVELQPPQLRVAQRAFLAAPGGSVELVANKSFAVEASISGTIPPEAVGKRAIATLHLNGEAVGPPVVFELGELSGELGKENPKAIFFSDGLTPGSHSLEVKIEPYPTDIEAGVFDSSSSVASTLNISALQTSMSLLLSAITGCVPAVVNCFSAPTTEEQLFFSSVQIPLTQNLLPISDSELTHSPGFNFSFSKPGEINSVELDYLYLWFQKWVTRNDRGIYNVTSDYFVKHGLTDNLDTNGLVLMGQPEVVFVTSNSASTMAHEIIHSLDESLPHSTERIVEGIGSQSSQISTTGWLLNTLQKLAKNSIDIFFRASDPAVDPALYSIGSAPYKAALNQLKKRNATSAAHTSFNRFSVANVDSEVILIGGTIDSANKAISTEIQRANTYLSVEAAVGDIQIEGLNSAGEVISVVETSSTNTIELTNNRGDSIIIERPTSLYTAVMPNNGTISKIQVFKDGVLVVTKRVDKLTLDDLVAGLNMTVFDLKRVQAESRLKFIGTNYRLYTSFQSARKPKQAAHHLEIIRLVLHDNAKQLFNLSDGSELSKVEALEIIDDVLKSL
jgi:hypothetical protein